MATGDFPNVQSGPALAQGEEYPLKKAMQESEPHRQELISELSTLFKQVMHEALCCLETVLPDFKEPGSNDAKLHNAMRARILNAANSRIRELPQIMRNYLVTQVFKREIVTRVQMPSYGLHNLPVGVRMPSDR